MVVLSCVYGIPMVALQSQGWDWIQLCVHGLKGGAGCRARCDSRVAPLREGRPRCEQTGFEHRPRCDSCGINRVVLERACARVCKGVCILGVCVGVEYFNYACRHLPTPNFFAPYFCAKPCLTVQKMPDHPKSGSTVGTPCPILPLWYSDSTLCDASPVYFGRAPPVTH